MPKSKGAAASKKNKNRPSPKEMRQRMADWMNDEDNNPYRLVSASKIKDFAKTVDPNIRMDKKVHVAICREVAKMLTKAVQRCYDNKRSTIRPTDI